MTDTQVAIPIGKSNATAVSTTGLAAGSLIVNTDDTNSVWVSTQSSMTSGYGTKIGPRGTATWRDANPCYAILDSAATAAVSLTVTQSLSDITDPVAIGAAVATKLLASGVPNVFQGSLIQNVRLSTLGPATYTVPVDLSKYAGLVVNLYQIGLDQLITLTWLDAPGGNVVAKQTYVATALRMTGAGTGADLLLTVAVKSPTLRIDFSRGSMTAFFGTGLIMYASNRVPVESVGNVDLGVDYSLTQAFLANTPVALGNITTNGGLHQARCFTNGTGTAFFGYETCDAVGNLKNIYLFKTAAGQDAYPQILLPRGAIQLIMLTNIVATYLAEFSVTPGNG